MEVCPAHQMDGHAYQDTLLLQMARPVGLGMYVKFSLYKEKL